MFYPIFTKLNLKSRNNSMNTSYDESFWLDFAKELSALRTREYEKLPYNFNLIDELGRRVNENANTRILLKLLSYNRNGEYAYLKSFLEMMQNNNPGLDFPMDKVVTPSIDFNREYIDGLIEERSKDYAVIIENKINWAVDQNRQIERYYNTVRNHGVNESRIYVIYLTADGNKKVSPYSLPEYLEKSLGTRFVNMDYRHDILPWLKETILPEVKIKEVLIESGIRQYIDYLEGQLGLRESEKPIRNTMNKAINEKLCLDGKSLSEKWKLLDNSVGNVANLLQSLQNMKADIVTQTAQDWDDITRQHLDKVYNGCKYGYYQIFFEGIDSSIHFEWYPFGEKELFDNANGVYRLVLHVEGDKAGNNMLRLSRMDNVNRMARDLHFVESYSGGDAIYKEYATPGHKPFASLSGDERADFLSNIYNNDVKPLKKIVEASFHKFDQEQECMTDLCKTMNLRHGDGRWTLWPEVDGWDIATDFNQSTHRIGIEGSFALREDNVMVFRSFVTVWEIAQWDVYGQRVQSEFPDCDAKPNGNRSRMYLHLPEIEIGNNLSNWEMKKDAVVNSLLDTYQRMETITSEIGK